MAMTLRRVVNGLRRRLRDRLQPVNAVSGVYSSFAEAMRNAPAVKPLGYDAANSGKWYKNRLDRVAQEDYPVLFWLQTAVLQDARSVFEIGGRGTLGKQGLCTGHQ